jgi:hypothetical protein
MALPLSGDPASLLNKTGYPTLWPSALPTTSSPAWTSAQNTLTTFLGSVTATGFDLTKSVLASPSTSSTARLVKFLSGGGPLVDGQDFTKLSGVLLKNGTAYESIVDTFIVGPSPKGQAVNPYTFSTSSTLNVTAIVNNLVSSGYLLSANELYDSTQFGAGATAPAAGSESLVYLYGLQNNNKITSAQTARIQALEAKNLRFFAAFLCEYCFYKTRYDLLLARFFEIYATPVASFTQPGPSSFIWTLANSPSGAGISQNDSLQILGYHLACLNTRMSDMRGMLGAINTFYGGVFTTLNSNLNDASLPGSNSKLQSTIVQLQTSADDATDYLAEKDFQKAAMEYNSEKNRYANIMLSLYAFLNIAALATVFQLARTQ